MVNECSTRDRCFLDISKIKSGPAAHPVHFEHRYEAKIHIKMECISGMEHAGLLILPDNEVPTSTTGRIF